MSDLMGMNLAPMAQQQVLRSQMQQSDVMSSHSVLDRLRSGERGTDSASTRQALRGAAEQFEAVFLNQLVSAMRKTVGDGGLVAKSQGEKMFEGMLDEEWAKNLAGRHGPGGLSEMIYRQLSRRMGLDSDAADATAGNLQASPPASTHPLLTHPAALPPVGLIDDER
jgi:flagellar protein FlgJ